MLASSYERYVRDLQLLVADVARGNWKLVTDDVHHALNGQASGELRRLVPRAARRQAGAFFTSGTLRGAFAGVVAGAPSHGVPFWDPTCGAGDLLIAGSKLLPVQSTLDETVASWGSKLIGTDLEAPFVESARLRLVLAAAARYTVDGSARRRSARLDTPPAQLFPRVVVGDGLAGLARARSWQGHLLLNPPFGPALVGKECPWSSGMVTQAAVFTEAAVRSLRIGSTITAILPDVLRSGSRYAAWRAHLEDMLDVGHVAPYGQFDEHTDIDVFVLQGSRKRRGQRSAGSVEWWPELDAEQRVEDAFIVRVGAVVDNRDPHEGGLQPYLTAYDMPAAGEMSMPSRSRLFGGSTVEPPFVALRRTSRPGPGVGGGTRAAGVLVRGDRAVAVDNHVITIRPLDGTEEKCLRLLRVLESPEVDKWLDERIRCRHLTVGVVRAIPWPRSED